MKFQLYINPLNKHVQIIAEGQGIASGDFVLLSERDPDEEIIFEEGCAYFNPLLKRQHDAVQLFLVNSARELIGYNSGKAPGYSNKAERKQCARGWFKLAPRNLNYLDIPGVILRQLQVIPRMKGVISQALRTGMGLRVPDELEASDFDAWIKWITEQRMAVTPTIRDCFGELKTNPHYLIFSEATRDFLATGIEPEPLVHVRMRRCEIRTVTQVSRQLFESYEHNMTLPKSVVEAGAEAILARAQEKYGEGWDKIQNYPTGSDVIPVDNKESVESGIVMFVKAPGDSEDRFWSGPPDLNRPSSIHDIFAKIIEQEEHNARKQT